MLAVFANVVGGVEVCEDCFEPVRHRWRLFVETVSFPVVAAVGGIVFAVPFLFLLFKFWFALEACVIGQYGPIKSRRGSWRLTTNYRGKFVLLALIAIGSASSLYLSTVIPEFGTGLAVAHPVLGVLSSSVSELLSIV